MAGFPGMNKILNKFKMHGFIKIFAAKTSVNKNSKGTDFSKLFAEKISKSGSVQKTGMNPVKVSTFQKVAQTQNVVSVTAANFQKQSNIINPALSQQETNDQKSAPVVKQHVATSSKNKDNQKSILQNQTEQKHKSNVSQEIRTFKNALQNNKVKTKNDHTEFDIDQIITTPVIPVAPVVVDDLGESVVKSIIDENIDLGNTHNLETELLSSDKTPVSTVETKIDKQLLNNSNGKEPTIAKHAAKVNIDHTPKVHVKTNNGVVSTVSAKPTDNTKNEHKNAAVIENKVNVGDTEKQTLVKNKVRPNMQVNIQTAQNKNIEQPNNLTTKKTADHKVSTTQSGNSTLNQTDKPDARHYQNTVTKSNTLNPDFKSVENKGDNPETLVTRNMNNKTITSLENKVSLPGGPEKNDSKVNAQTANEHTTQQDAVKNSTSAKRTVQTVPQPNVDQQSEKNQSSVIQTARNVGFNSDKQIETPAAQSKSNGVSLYDLPKGQNDITIIENTIKSENQAQNVKIKEPAKTFTGNLRNTKIIVSNENDLDVKNSKDNGTNTPKITNSSTPLEKNIPVADNKATNATENKIEKSISSDNQVESKQNKIDPDTTIRTLSGERPAESAKNQVKSHQSFVSDHSDSKDKPATVNDKMTVNSGPEKNHVNSEKISEKTTSQVNVDANGKDPEISTTVKESKQSSQTVNTNNAPIKNSHGQQVLSVPADENNIKTAFTNLDDQKAAPSGQTKINANQENKTEIKSELPVNQSKTIVSPETTLNDSEVKTVVRKTDVKPVNHNDSGTRSVTRNTGEKPIDSNPDPKNQQPVTEKGQLLHKADDAKFGPVIQKMSAKRELSFQKSQPVKTGPVVQKPVSQQIVKQTPDAPVNNTRMEDKDIFSKIRQIFVQATKGELEKSPKLNGSENKNKVVTDNTKATPKQTGTKPAKQSGINKNPSLANESIKTEIPDKVEKSESKTIVSTKQLSTDENIKDSGKVAIKTKATETTIPVKVDEQNVRVEQKSHVLKLDTQQPVQSNGNQAGTEQKVVTETNVPNKLAQSQKSDSKSIEPKSVSNETAANKDESMNIKITKTDSPKVLDIKPQLKKENSASSRPVTVNTAFDRSGRNQGAENIVLQTEHHKTDNIKIDSGSFDKNSVRNDADNVISNSSEKNNTRIQNNVAENFQKSTAIKDDIVQQVAKPLTEKPATNNERPVILEHEEKAKHVKAGPKLNVATVAQVQTELDEISTENKNVPLQENNKPITKENTQQHKVDPEKQANHTVNVKLDNQQSEQDQQHGQQHKSDETQIKNLTVNTSSAVSTSKVTITDTVTRAQVQHIVQTIQEQVDRFQQNNSQRLQLNTRTSELGMIRIELLKQQDEVQVVLKVQSEQSQKALEQALPELKQALVKGPANIQDIKVVYTENRQQQQNAQQQGFERNKNQTKSDKDQKVGKNSKVAEKDTQFKQSLYEQVA